MITSRSRPIMCGSAARINVDGAPGVDVDRSRRALDDGRGRSAGSDAGVRDHDVDAAELLGRPVAQRGELVEGPHVAGRRRTTPSRARSSPLRDASPRFTPRSWSIRATSAPMPRLAPVITAVLPCEAHAPSLVEVVATRGYAVRSPRADPGRDRCGEAASRRDARRRGHRADPGGARHDRGRGLRALPARGDGSRGRRLREHRSLLREGARALPAPDLPRASASAVRRHARQGGDVPLPGRGRLPLRRRRADRVACGTGRGRRPGRRSRSGTRSRSTRASSTRSRPTRCTGSRLATRARS